MDGLTWKKVHAYFYRRRNNKVPDTYYESKFKIIEEFFENRPITYESADEFLAWLEEDFMAKNGKPISNSYYNKYLTLLKVCAKLCGHDISEYIQRNEKEDAVKTEKLTVQEYERLIQTDIPYVRDREYRNFREILIIKVANITTQRIGNIRTLQWNNLVGNYLYIRMTKNGKPHKVYINDRILADMGKLRRYPHNFIFGSERGAFNLEWLTEMIKKRCKMVGITKRITGKSLRGTGITAYLKDKKTPLHKVAKISNHSDTRVLANHYYDPEDGEIEEIVNNNPFDPEPLTEEGIYEILNECVATLQKRNCQAVLIPQNNNYILTVPKRV